MTDDLTTWLRARFDDDERWALAASRPYRFADEGSTAPTGGVHWRWVTGENWDTVHPDPAVMEFVEGPDGSWSANLATVEKWPSTLRIDAENSRTRMMPRAYANSIEEIDSAAGGHIIRHDPARVLAEVDAKRRILDEHLPEWRTVEWPHDQNGKGEGLVCRRCQNAEHTEWKPEVGHAGVLPEGFVTPYVLGPCPTLRLLMLPYADRDGYRSEWAP